MQKFIAIGKITADPILKKNANNKDYVNFDIAVRKNKTEPEFISCISWGITAVNLCKFVKKGDNIFVDGEINSYKAKIYNTEHSYKKFQVRVITIEFLDNKKSDEILNDKILKTDDLSFDFEELEITDDGSFLD